MTVDALAARAFGAMAEEYDRGRPGWPADAVAEIVARFEARTVLDLAAGTGKLTAVLAELTDDVVAVEPVDGMRRVLDSRRDGESPSTWPPMTRRPGGGPNLHARARPPEEARLLAPGVEPARTTSRACP
jgi:SAM-dependent methyltransferase